MPKSDDSTTKKTDKEKTTVTVAMSLEEDLQNRLAGVEFAPLRSILLREGILTMDQFNALDLRDFMTRHNIYHKDLRARMYRRLSENGKPFDVPSRKKEHTITVAENSYTGETPAQAFLRFCDSYIGKYPAEIRKLVNAPYRGDQPVVLHQWNTSEKMLRLTGINAFVDPEMTAEDADKYAAWICRRCEELNNATKAEKKEYTITVAKNCYTGATPAQAFLVFCNSLIVKYPDEMRQLVNAPFQGLQPVVLHQWNSNGKMLRLTGINAFIDPEMATEEAEKYANWICTRCKELNDAANAAAPAIAETKSHRKDDEAAGGEKPDNIKEAAPSVADSHSHQNNVDEENEQDNGGNEEPSARLASGLSEERLQDICLTDLSKSNDFSFCQFDFLEIEGVRYSAASSWRGAYIWTMNQLLRTHPEAFRIVLEKQRGLRDHTGATCVLENGSVICVQYSATELMRRLVGAIAICGIPVRSVIVGY